MAEEIPATGAGNLKDYDKAYQAFNWASLDGEFDWSRGGPYNVAAEAVDRHARDSPNKVAIHSVWANGEMQSLTFRDISRSSSCFADGLRKMGVRRGDRVFVYLDRRSELFIAIIGIADRKSVV